MTRSDPGSALKEETFPPLTPSWQPTNPILVIEPSLADSRLFETCFQKWNYPHTILAAPEEALAFLQHRPASLIITDLGSPQHPSLPCLAPLKAQAPATPIMVTSTMPSLETALEAMRQGAVDYLEKPLTSTHLYQAIERIANRPDLAEISTRSPSSPPSRRDQLLETFFDSITEGIYVLDRDLHIMLVNQAERERLRMSPAQIRGQRFDHLGWQEATPRVIDLIRQTFVTGQKQHWVTIEANQSDLVSEREIHLYPIFSVPGKVRHVIVLAQDTTAQKQLQATLFQSASLAGIGQLATSIAHEVNNPLTIALTNAQLIMMEMKPGDPYYEMVEDIHYSCNRISNIVSNLVDFSNQAIYDFSPVNLIETIEDTLAFIAHPLREASVAIERAYTETPTIVASRNHLKTIWINLLLNACEAIATTKKPGKISIDTHRDQAGWVIIQISDTGIGIARKHFKDIFNPFFSTKPASHSVGLGLFTTRTIIDKHHGRISFKSKPGLTICTVALPEQGPADLSPPEA